MNALRSLHVLSAAVALMALSGCTDDREGAAVFSRAALYAFNQDFITEPVTQRFTAAELSMLQRHQDLLEPMVEQALTHDSAGAALLAAHFKLANTLPHLRWRLFQPGRTYGWEGPAYDSEEDYLNDAQYVYHSVYAAAIEAVAGAPLHEAIKPTGEERALLEQLSAAEANESYHWAKWLSRKLRLQP